MALLKQSVADAALLRQKPKIARENELVQNGYIFIVCVACSTPSHHGHLHQLLLTFTAAGHEFSEPCSPSSSLLAIDGASEGGWSRVRTP